MAKDPKAREKPPGNGLKRLEERLMEGERSQSFAAYVRENWDRFHRLIVRVGRRADKWDIIAEWANKEKITGDRELKPGAARRAYERVRAERLPKKDRGKRSSEQPARNPAPVRMLDIPDPSGTKAKLDSLIERMERG